LRLGLQLRNQVFEAPELSGIFTLGRKIQTSGFKIVLKIKYLIFGQKNA